MSTHDLHWSEALVECRKRGEAYVLASVIFKTGSTPRDSGTKMVITADHSYDTVGGGRLEFMVIQRAREMILQDHDQQCLENFPLAAKTQQCCGGSVSILLECFQSQQVNVHVFGAGHVAKALMKILPELEMKLHWIDSRADQFPSSATKDVQRYVMENPVAHVAAMQAQAYALILTHDHALDYRLVEALLDRKDCAYIGLIGSQTKAKRFKRRLKSASFSQTEIDSVVCPVGLSSVPGKRPMEVAVSISAQLIQQCHMSKSVNTQKREGVSWPAMHSLLKNTDENESPTTVLNQKEKDYGLK